MKLSSRLSGLKAQYQFAVAITVLEIWRSWRALCAFRPFHLFVNLPLPKNPTYISLALDAMRLACLARRPRLVILGSGDLDFVSLVARLLERGSANIVHEAKAKHSELHDQLERLGGSGSERLICGFLSCRKTGPFLHQLHAPLNHVATPIRMLCLVAGKVGQ